MSIVPSSPPPAVRPPASSALPWCAAPGCPGWRGLWAPAAAAPSASAPLASPAAPGTAAPAWTAWPGSRRRRRRHRWIRTLPLLLLLRTRFPEISLACYRRPVPPTKKNTVRNLSLQVHDGTACPCSNSSLDCFLFKHCHVSILSVRHAVDLSLQEILSSVFECEHQKS